MSYMNLYIVSGTPDFIKLLGSTYHPTQPWL